MNMFSEMFLKTKVASKSNFQCAAFKTKYLLLYYKKTGKKVKKRYTSVYIHETGRTSKIL